MDPARRPGTEVTDGRSPLRLLGLREVAAVLGTDWRNVRALVERGELPAIHVGETREPRISLAMLEEWQRRLAASGSAVLPAVSPAPRVATLPLAAPHAGRSRRTTS